MSTYSPRHETKAEYHKRMALYWFETRDRIEAMLLADMPLPNGRPGLELAKWKIKYHTAELLTSK